MDKYFATANPKDLVSELNCRVTDFDALLEQSGLNRIINRNIAQYYSFVFETDESGLSFGGDAQELVQICVNEARVLITQLIALISKSRLAFSAIAQTNEDSTLTSARVANAILAQTVSRKNIDKLGDKMLEYSMVTGRSYIIPEWDNTLGDIYISDEDGKTYHTGDVTYHIPFPSDVIFDYRCEEVEEWDWFIHRVRKNRWDLIAQHPRKRDAILALPQAPDVFTESLNSSANSAYNDFVYVYKFFHKPTPASPQGRILYFSDERTIYYDQSNDYGFLPIIECKPERLMLTGFGYPGMSTLLPLQTMLDTCFSAISTNNSALGVQAITCPTQANIDVRDVGGMNFILFDAVPGVANSGAPSPLQLTATAPETFKFTDMLRSYLVELSGLNQAIRGTPPAGVDSGRAIATLSSNAIELTSSISKAYIRALEQLMYYTILCYRQFATVPQVVSILGDNNVAIAEKFIGTDLQDVKSVSMKVAAPIAQTSSGRLTIAQDLLEAGLIKDSNQYIEVLETGSVQAAYSGILDEQALIKQENQNLLEGGFVRVVATDSHASHIMAHKSLLSDTTIRSDETLAAKILDHISEHISVAKSTDPFLTGILETGKVPPPPEVVSPGGAQ